jgi:hypothetical protein
LASQGGGKPKEIAMWNDDRTMYCGTPQPDAFERALLWAHGEIHWLKVRTDQNLKRIAQMDRARASNV